MQNFLLALPAIPLWIGVGLLICLIVPAIYYWCTRRRPWRAKERALKLLRTAPTRDLKEVQAEVSAILQVLISEDLVLKDAVEHNDRAHAYRLLGDLQVLQMNFIDAESYRAAIECYNDALKLEPDNQIAISNKFKTVESIRELERTRF